MIRYNNTEIEDVHYNGQDKESVTYNGVVVFDGGETTLTIREWGAMDLFWPYGNGRTFTTNETAMAISLATTDNNKYIGEFSVTSSVTKADSYHNSSGSFNVSGPSHIGSGTYLTVIHKPNGYSDGKNYGYMKLTLTLSSPKIDKDYVIETNPGNGDYGHYGHPRLSDSQSRYSAVILAPYSIGASFSKDILGLAFQASKIENNGVYGFNKDHELSLIRQYDICDNIIWPSGSTEISSSELELEQKISKLNITTMANNVVSPKIGCVDITDEYDAVIRVFLLQNGKYIKFGASNPLSIDLNTLKIIDLSTIGNTYYFVNNTYSMCFESGVENYINMYDKYGSVITPYNVTNYGYAVKQWYSSSGIYKLKVINTP